MSDILTPGECDLWRAVFAASWHATGGRSALGHLTDEARALWCTQEADRALNALLALRSSHKHLSPTIGQVLT